MSTNNFEKEVKDKIKCLGKLMGFEIEEEWTPSTLKGKSRRDFTSYRYNMV